MIRYIHFCVRIRIKAMQRYLLMLSDLCGSSCLATQCYGRFTALCTSRLYTFNISRVSRPGMFISTISSERRNVWWCLEVCRAVSIMPRDFMLRSPKRSALLDGSTCMYRRLWEIRILRYSLTPIHELDASMSTYKSIGDIPFVRNVLVRTCERSNFSFGGSCMGIWYCMLAQMRYRFKLFIIVITYIAKGFRV